MKLGFAFKMTEDKKSVGVVYTGHFVERYHEDDAGHLAVCKVADEAFVQSAIREAIPVIVYEIQDSGVTNGIIRSKSKKVNMSFSVRFKDDGYTLVMLNTMYKAHYKPLHAHDFVVDVNPQFKIHFDKGLDVDLKASVLDHLMGIIHELEPDAGYTQEGIGFRYIVEMAGENVYVCDAIWSEDMLIVDVK
jgi:hypothetical protein